jgi:hypothetical protein
LAVQAVTEETAVTNALGSIPTAGGVPDSTVDDDSNEDKSQAKKPVTEDTAAADTLGSTPTAGGVPGYTVDVDSDADKSQAKQAVTEETAAIDTLGSTPTPGGVSSSAVDIGSNAHKRQAKRAVDIDAPRSTSAVGSASGLVDLYSDADKRQAKQVVTDATRAIDPLGSTPAAAAVLSSVVDVGSKVVSGVEAFNNTWGTMLKRIELFNKIVASIAEVF